MTALLPIFLLICVFQRKAVYFAGTRDNLWHIFMVTGMVVPDAVVVTVMAVLIIM